MRSTWNRKLVWLAVVALAACGTEAGPSGPEVAPQFAKGGNGGGNKGDDGSTTVLVADVVATAEGQIASTCPGEVTSSYGVLFRHSGCLIVSLDTYALTDDVSFNVKTRKGEIIEMTLTGQDAIGDAGIMHETDNLLSAPVRTSASGFTVSIDRTVTVYRLSGHLRGSRVGIAGYVSIGDIVYRPQS